MNLTFHGIKHENTAVEMVSHKCRIYLKYPRSYKYYTLISHIDKTSNEHNSCIIFNIRFKK